MEQSTSSRAGKPWDAAEESVLLQSLSAGIMPEEIAGGLQRKVGGINSRRYTIAERIVSQGGTIAQAAELVKYTPEQVHIHMNKVAGQSAPVQTPQKINEVYQGAPAQKLASVQTEQGGVTMQLIHKVGAHIGLSMDHYVGKVHTWEDTNFLTFRDRNNPKGKSL